MLLALQLVDNFLEVVGLHLAGHDLHHLLADLTHLLVLGVRGLPDLVGALLGETYTEQTQKVPICGLHVHVGLDHSLVGGGGSWLVQLSRAACLEPACRSEQLGAKVFEVSKSVTL